VIASSAPTSAKVTLNPISACAQAVCRPTVLVISVVDD
jgi:hypothetical protein